MRPTLRPQKFYYLPYGLILYRLCTWRKNNNIALGRSTDVAVMVRAAAKIKLVLWNRAVRKRREWFNDNTGMIPSAAYTEMLMAYEHLETIGFANPSEIAEGGTK